MKQSKVTLAWCLCGSPRPDNLWLLTLRLSRSGRQAEGVLPMASEYSKEQGFVGDLVAMTRNDQGVFSEVCTINSASENSNRNTQLYVADYSRTWWVDVGGFSNGPLCEQGQGYYSPFGGSASIRHLLGAKDVDDKSNFAGHKISMVIKGCCDMTEDTRRSSSRGAVLQAAATTTHSTLKPGWSGYPRIWTMRCAICNLERPRILLEPQEGEGG
jgi:hypothetical protein